MTETPEPRKLPWKRWQRITFLFSFLFLGLTSVISWELNIFFASSAVSDKAFGLDTMFKPLAGLFFWLDRHIFHTGYNPKIHSSFPQDNHFGAVFYLTIFLISVVVTVIWIIADRKRPSYDKLFFWFCLYLRYTLAVTIIGYGIDKFIPVQMQYPSVADMLTPYGSQSRFNVLWNFMGMSPGYMMLTGGCEIIAGLLLFSRRTIVFGYLFLLTILVNVVALNWFYNIPVKMFSAQLMLCNLFLLTPYLSVLTRFFFFNDNKGISVRYYTFQPKWKRHSLTGSLVIIPLIISLLVLTGSYARYKKQKAYLGKEKLYNVIYFVAKDTLPPLTTDTLRWKNFLFSRNSAVIVSMNDNQDWFKCDIDDKNKTFVLHDNPDKTTWKTFSYAYPSKDKLQLKGKWKGKDILVEMTASPIDSIPLNKEKIRLVQD